MKPLNPRALLQRVMRTALAAAVCGSVFLIAPPASGVGDEIAVAGRVFNGYKRTRLPDRSYEQETYTFAPGGLWGAPIAGDPIDDVPFMFIARTLVGPLARIGYVGCGDPKKTKLLIFVFWGTTRGTEDRSASPAFEQMQQTMSLMNQDLVSARQAVRSGGGDAGTGLARDQEVSSALMMLILEQNARDQIDRSNAMILGFQTELWRAWTTQMFGSTWDFLTELRSNRYFVVLKAYDFQEAYQHKRRKVLWESRFSIRERGVVFSEQLPAMAEFASQYFGKELNNLIRRPMPEGKIDLGQPKFMSFEPATGAPTRKKTKP